MRFRRLMTKWEPLLFLLGAGLLLAFPRKTSAYALIGVELCLNSVIPSLFPFFVLTALFQERALPLRLGSLLAPVFRRCFRLSGAGGSVFLLGLVSGYPVGAAAASALYRSGGCGKEEAQRLLIIANNCGPAFLLGVLGGRVFGRTGPAFLLLAIHAAVTLWLAALLGAMPGPPPGEQKADAAPAPLSAAFSTAVLRAGSSVLTVCAYVILFSVPVRFLPEIPLLRGLAELTAGLSAMEGFSPKNAAVAAFLLGWGGLSVCAQVLRHAREAGLSAGPYLAGRLLHGLVSALAAWCCFTRPLLLIPLVLAGAAAAVFAKRGGKRQKSGVYCQRGESHDFSKKDGTGLHLLQAFQSRGGGHLHLPEAGHRL